MNLQLMFINRRDRAKYNKTSIFSFNHKSTAWISIQPPRKRRNYHTMYTLPNWNIETCKLHQIKRSRDQPDYSIIQHTARYLTLTLQEIWEIVRASKHQLDSIERQTLQWPKPADITSLLTLIFKHQYTIPIMNILEPLPSHLGCISTLIEGHGHQRAVLA